MWKSAEQNLQDQWNYEASQQRYHDHPTEELRRNRPVTEIPRLLHYDHGDLGPRDHAEADEKSCPVVSDQPSRQPGSSELAHNGGDNEHQADDSTLTQKLYVDAKTQANKEERRKEQKYKLEPFINPVFRRVPAECQAGKKRADRKREAQNARYPADDEAKPGHDDNASWSRFQFQKPSYKRAL
jgi:hypothetical protein